jgi:hypothetical protein
MAVPLPCRFDRDTAVRDTGTSLIAFRSHLSSEGFVEEDGEIWSRGGVLLAQSRQLAVVM